jgi:predicted porin
MWAMAYSYDLSKRTSLALTYAQIKNNSGATYNLFTSTSLGLGGSAGAIQAGEDPKMFGLTMRHAF